MIHEIIIRNNVTGNEITISAYSNTYVLDSIDWDSPAVQQSTYRVPKQIGSSLSGVSVNTRKPSIYGYVVADMSNENTLGMTYEEYYAMQEEKIRQSKSELNKLISVFQDVTIEADGYYLDARPTSPVKFSADEEENNEVLCYFSIDLECYNPMFYGGEKTVDMADAIGLFHFPLIIPPEKLAFGYILRRQSISITNEGDAPVGCIITITARGGAVTDPRIYNVNTGEYIGFDGVSLAVGESIVITTEVSEENAVKVTPSSAEGTSLIGNVTIGSKYLKIEQGGDLYAYDVDEEEINNVDISVSYTERYFNIPGM